jgi:aromatic-L-amino-acid/L-tryptophan decarboxylase
LATTMGCGMFLVRDKAVLPATFEVAADFMPSKAASTDPYMTSVQWSRRFLGLRLFLALASAGWGGYADHVERAIGRIQKLGETLAAQGWWVANEPRLAVLCLEPPERRGDLRTIVRSIVESGRAWISVASFEGRDVIRICATHGETRESDVAELVRALEGEG